MEKNFLHILQLLTEIDSGVKVTQRSLSKKLGVALGPTNAYLKRLINKGFLEFHRGSTNNVRYVLTPSGLMEKSRLSYEYLQYSLGFYREMRTEIQSCIDGLEGQGIKYLVLYGVGEVADIAYVCLYDSSLEIAGVIDDHRSGRTFFGHHIQEPVTLSDLDFETVLITSLESAAKISQELICLGIPKEKIIRLGERS